MKRKIIFILLLMLPLPMFAKFIGRVKFIKGRVTLFDIRAKKTRLLKLHDRIKRGVVIRTGQKSRIFIKFINGIIKYIPENTSITILNPYKSSNFLKNKEKLLKKIIGIKAWEEIDEDESGRAWYSLEISIRKIKSYFKKGQYFKVINLILQENIPLSNNELLYIAAVSHYYLRNEKKAISLFKKIIISRSKELKKQAYYGLFLCYKRTGNRKKMVWIQNIFRKKYRRSVFYKTVQCIIKKK